MNAYDLHDFDALGGESGGGRSAEAGARAQLGDTLRFWRHSRHRVRERPFQRIGGAGLGPGERHYGGRLLEVRRPDRGLRRAVLAYCQAAARWCSGCRRQDERESPQRPDGE